MTSIHDECISWLGELQEISKRILQLDLENEHDVEQLILLQAKQAELRSAMSTPEHSRVMSSGSLRSLLEECLQIESEVNSKLAAQREIYRGHIEKMQAAQRTKQAYYQSYAQSDGFFIDRKK